MLEFFPLAFPLEIVMPHVRYFITILNAECMLVMIMVQWPLTFFQRFAGAVAGAAIFEVQAEWRAHICSEQVVEL